VIDRLATVPLIEDVAKAADEVRQLGAEDRERTDAARAELLRRIRLALTVTWHSRRSA
jgi:hypothetical protein